MSTLESLSAAEAVPHHERTEGRASLLGKFYDLWATQELAIYTKQHLLAAYFIVFEGE